jgi:hypothetical protein
MNKRIAIKHNLHPEKPDDVLSELEAKHGLNKTDLTKATAVYSASDGTWNGTFNYHEYSIYETMETQVGATIQVNTASILARNSLHLGANFINGENVLTFNHAAFVEKTIKALNEYDALRAVWKAAKDMVGMPVYHRLHEPPCTCSHCTLWDALSHYDSIQQGTK